MASMSSPPRSSPRRSRQPDPESLGSTPISTAKAARSARASSRSTPGPAPQILRNAVDVSARGVWRGRSSEITIACTVPSTPTVGSAWSPGGRFRLQRERRPGQDERPRPSITPGEDVGSRSRPERSPPPHDGEVCCAVLGDESLNASQLDCAETKVTHQCHWRQPELR